MPHMTKATDDVWMGLNHRGFYVGMFCSVKCTVDDFAVVDVQRLTVEDMNDDEDDELWEDGQEGPHVRTPRFGHYCHNPNCENLVWD